MRTHFPATGPPEPKVLGPRYGTRPLIYGDETG